MDSHVSGMSSMKQSVVVTPSPMRSQSRVPLFATVLTLQFRLAVGKNVEQYTVILMSLSSCPLQSNT